jgi:hypothetical protein
VGPGERGLADLLSIACAVPANVDAHLRRNPIRPVP